MCLSGVLAVVAVVVVVVAQASAPARGVPGGGKGGQSGMCASRFSGGGQPWASTILAIPAPWITCIGTPMARHSFGKERPRPRFLGKRGSGRQALYWPPRSARTKCRVAPPSNWYSAAVRSSALRGVVRLALVSGGSWTLCVGWDWVSAISVPTCVGERRGSPGAGAVFGYRVVGGRRPRERVTRRGGRKRGGPGYTYICLPP